MVVLNKIYTRTGDDGTTALGSDEVVGSPADFAKIIVAETEKWARVIKFANIKPE